MAKWRSLLAGFALVSVLASCGGSEPAGDTGETTPVETTTGDTVASDTTVRAPERTTSDDTMPVPEGFPAPFMGGGGVVFESEDEIRVGYAPEDYDLIIDFYQQWSQGQSHRLIDNNPNYTWDFPDFTITLEVDPAIGNLVIIKRNA